MNAVRYFLYTDTQLAKLREQFELLVQEWAKKWLPNPAQNWVVAQVSDAYTYSNAPKPTTQQDFANAQQLCLQSSHDHLIEATHSSTLPHYLFQLAAGDATSSSANSSHLVRATGREILKDLLQTALQRATQNSRAEISEQQPKRYKGCGTLHIEIQQGPQVIQLLISAAVVKAFLEEQLSQHSTHTKPKLQSRRQAIGKGKLTLHVELGQAELKLADLLSLAPGQVIRLNQTIRTPLRVVASSNNTLLCHAFLGQQEGCKAVQLLHE